MRCDQCGTTLNREDYDAQHGVGLCPRCGNFIRDPAHVPAPPLVDQRPPPSSAPYREGAQADAPHALEPPISRPTSIANPPEFPAFQPPSSVAQNSPALALMSRAALDWSERDLAGGGLEIRVKSQSTGPMLGLAVGSIIALSGAGMIFCAVLTHSSSPRFLWFVGMIFVAAGGLLVHRSVRMLGAATFRFRPHQLEVETRAEITNLPASDIVDFAHVLAANVSAGKMGQSRESFFGLQLRTRRGIVEIRGNLAGERHARELTDRLNELVRAIKSS